LYVPSDDWETVLLKLFAVQVVEDTTLELLMMVTVLPVVQVPEMVMVFLSVELVLVKNGFVDVMTGVVGVPTVLFQVNTVLLETFPAKSVWVNENE
jgi:hypothetical protein